MITRRKLLWTAGAALGGAAVYPVIVEPRWLEVTRTGLRLGRGWNSPIRVLHLTDFHASWLVPFSNIHRAIALGLAERPDLICLTGDFITFRSGFDVEAYVSALRRLASARPTFAVLGNHDGGRWAMERGGYPDHTAVERVLAAAGVRLLHNRSERVSVRGIDLTVVGVGDLWSEELEAAKAFRDATGQGPVLMLSHNPDSKDVLGMFRWDLMLCGHTHGGQVMVPFEGPYFAPVADKRFVAGLRGWHGRQIYVSRGVGSLGSVRFRCRPEVSILELG